VDVEAAAARLESLATEIKGLGAEMLALEHDMADAEAPARAVTATVEWRYALQTVYVAERGDTEPVRIPADRLDAAAHVDVSGGIAEILARLGAERAETNRRLGDLTPAQLLRPTVWVGCDIDARFHLHRFAVHVIEHSIQCEKTLGALGWRPAEGRRIGRRLAALLGEIEGLGGAAEAREIEARLVERLASAA